MKIVTSFSPSRVERQRKCLESWMKIGCEVIAVQSPGESEKLSQLFSEAAFIETHLVGDKFGRPELVRVKALCDQALEEPVLILNSDIEIEMSPEQFRFYSDAPPPFELRIGVRWDRHPETGETRLFKWGIDAFVITPQIARVLPDIGMAMGCPAWDYWIPWVMNKRGYRINTNLQSGLIHELHAQRWSQKEYHAGLRLMAHHHHVGSRQLAMFIQRVTGRTKTPNWRPAIKEMR